MICACIMAAGPSEAADLAARALEIGAGAVEIRGDRFESFPLADLARSIPAPSIFTLRGPACGGHFRGTEQERMNLLSLASRSGFAYVDVEYGSCAAVADFSCPVILSHHDFRSCPPDLGGLAASMAAEGPFAVKIAVTPSCSADVVRILRLQRNPPCRASVFGLGPMGFSTRILGAAAGGFMTYAAVRAGAGTAEYQPLVPDLLGMYSGAAPGSAIYGVAGMPALHSLGPRAHNALFRRRGIPAVYVPFEVDDLAPLAAAAFELGIRGLSVTMPFKEEAAVLADRLTPAAAAAGAANTLTFEAGSVEGDNTDSAAVVAAAESRAGRLSGRKVLVIGAGGAARAAVAGFCAAGAIVTVTNRTESRGADLAARFGAAFKAPACADPSDYDVLVQASAAGMGRLAGIEAVPGGRARRGAVAVEMVYDPAITAFAAAATKAGAEVVGGAEVFALQAALQFRRWTGEAASAAEVLGALAGGECA